ncbi:hypothetical protein [Thermococcus sp. Bubb.Bath]|uniref:hypothetical protein n=1 Tax=Thermococcus sp. Bubb.Bath TaxID=1638242 RepID=UPI00143CA94C|nr:hypothetical protein [Thermococcus sp. Bubb.Bath]NJF24516.1 hypothetical protein [Thermococcus sp. Bubb.Bath]
MEENDLRQRLLELSKREASLNFKMYELYEENMTLAIKLAGYIAENRLLGGSWNDEEAKRVMDKYLVKEKSEQKSQ